ncbi:MAG: general secretion pathway protein GspB [Steroidobacteraceae bacterium]
MSFILDALRKSEHERQRTTGPGLAEVAVAPSKPRTNAWATAAIALLVVNLVAVGILMLRKGRDAPPAPAVATAGPETATAPAAAAPMAAAPAESPAQVSVTRSLPEPPPMLRPAEAVPVAPATRNPLEQEVSGHPPPIDPRMAAGASAAPEGPPAVTRSPTGGTVVYQTLPEAGLAPPPGEAAPARQSAHPALPTVDEVTAGGGLPELRLELHVYANQPQERFAFINSRKYREGDTLAEGPQVEEITRDGVVLNLRGNRFLLPRE